MSEMLKMYIAGEWMESESGQTMEIINPANGETIAYAAAGTEYDARKAIIAARQAFDNSEWRTFSALRRANMLYAVADALERQAALLARNETLNNGKPLREAEADVGDAINCFRYYAGLATKPHGQTYEVPDDMQSFTVREPLGVCGQIVPWNFPLLMAAWKLAPALAAGNTVVFKPSELTPVTAVMLFEVLDQVGFPPGVVNLVLGLGPIVGHEIAVNHAVDKVAFTGGTVTGRSIMQAAIGNLKKVSLELGGKSPNIVFADADFETAVDYALFGIYINQGEVCSAGSRLLLEDAIYDRFMHCLVEKTGKIKVGPGLNPESQMGPLISRNHMEKVLDYIRTGREEGAALVCGGKQLTAGALARGYFVEPTIFIDTNPAMRIVQEEIFGPVLVVQRFTGENQAIALANNTVYGLAGGVFTSDGAKALRVIKKLRAGITWVNSYQPTFNEAPWGGYKYSGIGRELGTYGYEEYTEVKQININLNVQPTGWYTG